MNHNLLENLEAIEREKNIDKGLLLETLRSALLSACKKTFPDPEDYDVEIDPKTGEIRVLKKGKLVHHADFGRIAAQTAKQVIIQKIREAERDSLHDEFSKKVGDIVTGTVHRVDNKSITVDLGKVEGVLPIREQFPKDYYRQGDTIRVFVMEVKKTPRGPEIIVSRAHPHLVKRLFELEVPEIGDNIVEIKTVAREAGSRSKIAVFSNDEKVDCVGSCVGMRGQRVKNVVRELQGEKIDIVRWSDDPVSYIKNALSPAILSEVNLDREKMRADVLVEDDQLSLAIGKKGQNVRLASRLTGWQIDVRSKSQRVPLSQLEGVDENIEGLLKRAGIHSIKDILKSTVEDLVKIEGISAECAEKIIQEAHRVILEKDQTPLSTALDEAVADQVAEVAPQEATEEAPKKEPKKAKKKDKKPKETKETSAETQEE
jgi:N utilization substance protein A